MLWYLAYSAVELMWNRLTAYSYEMMYLMSEHQEMEVKNTLRSISLQAGQLSAGLKVHRLTTMLCARKDNAECVLVCNDYDDWSTLWLIEVILFQHIHQHLPQDDVLVFLLQQLHEVQHHHASFVGLLQLHCHCYMEEEDST